MLGLRGLHERNLDENRVGEHPTGAQSKHAVKQQLRPFRHITHGFETSIATYEHVMCVCSPHRLRFFTILHRGHLADGTNPESGIHELVLTLSSIRNIILNCLAGSRMGPFDTMYNNIPSTPGAFSPGTSSSGPACAIPR
jgi:hypothetical protein